MSQPRPHRARPVADPVVDPLVAGQELASERRFGRAQPLTEGLGLLADYLAGLRAAMGNPSLRIAAAAALPHWESYVRGVRDRADQLIRENRP